MNLGARSHSGNSPEADAEGWIAFAQERNHRAEKTARDHKWICIERVISSYMIRSSEEMTRSPSHCRSIPFPKTSPAKKQSMESGRAKGGPALRPAEVRRRRETRAGRAPSPRGASNHWVGCWAK